MTLKFIKYKWPYFYRVYLYLFQNKLDKKFIGDLVSFGNENPDKTFFIIKLNNPQLGLMAIYNSVLGYLRIADAKGYIPVVDLKNFDNGYLEKDEIGIKNAWEYYFEQPTSFTLEEAYRSKNVMFSSGDSPREAHPMSLKLNLESKYYFLLYRRLSDKYIRLNNSISEKLISESNRILDNKRVIGVSSRGSDMINLKGHAKQPSTMDLIKKTKEMLVKWNCEYVFLATEEEHVVKLFEEHFGEKLLIDNSFRISEFKEYIPFVEISSHRENDKYLKGLEYLTTVTILSRCTCLIGTVIGKTIGALAINKSVYENTYFFDLGLY